MIAICQVPFVGMLASCGGGDGAVAVAVAVAVTDAREGPVVK